MWVVVFTEDWKKIRQRWGIYSSSTKKNLQIWILTLRGIKVLWLPYQRGLFTVTSPHAATVHLAVFSLLSVVLSVLLTAWLASVLGILGLIFWNSSRTWVTWQKKIKRACFSYLLLHSKPPQNSVAENNSHFIIVHNAVGKPELSRMLISSGLIWGVSCCCRQIVGPKPPRWLHSHAWLEGWAEVTRWGRPVSLPLWSQGLSLSMWALHKIPSAGQQDFLHVCSGLQNAQKQKPSGLCKAQTQNRQGITSATSYWMPGPADSGWQGTTQKHEWQEVCWRLELLTVNMWGFVLS